MAILSVQHVTRYDYAAPIKLGEHRMMLRPRDSNDQRLLSADLQIDPEPSRLRWIHDVFDNCVAVADFEGQTSRLQVESQIVVEHRISSEPDVRLDESARLYPFAYDVEELPDLSRAIERRHPDPTGEIDRWARRFVNLGTETETGSMLMTLTFAIKEGFAYERRTAKGTQTPLQTLETKRGSCRDFASLMMEAARALGLAARFVTGYLYVPDRENEAAHQGGGATHAWCQIYLPGAGWVEFDPTNGIVGSRDLIRVAVARDARQAIPLHGCYYGAADALDAMTVSVDVRKLAENKDAARAELAET